MRGSHLAAEIDEGVAALGDEHARSVVPAGIADTQRRGAGRAALRRSRAPARRTARRTALRAATPTSVRPSSRHVEQRRRDLPLRPWRRRPAPAAGAADRRGAPGSQRHRGSPMNSSASDDDRGDQRSTISAATVHHRRPGIAMRSRRCVVAEADDAVDERLHDRVLVLVARRAAVSCCGLVRKPISTSTAGMLAPTSTRNGACCSARGLIGTRSRSDASIALRERRRLARCSAPAPSPRGSPRCRASRRRAPAASPLRLAPPRCACVAVLGQAQDRRLRRR